MTETILLIAAALVLAFVVNLVPAFMPSTWMVLAVFYIKFDLPLLALTISGAIVSGFGRLLLARGSTAFKRQFMAQRERDLDDLGQLLDEHRHVICAYGLRIRADAATDEQPVRSGRHG